MVFLFSNHYKSLYLKRIKHMLFKNIQKTYSISTARKFFIYGIGQFFNVVSPLLIIPHVVSVCHEEGLGKVGVGFSIAFILIVVIDFSSYINGIRDISQNKLEKKTQKEIIISHFYAKIFLFLGLFFIVTIVTFLVPYLFNQLDIVGGALFVVFAQVFNPTWVFQGEEDFFSQTILNSISKLIYLFGVFYFVNAEQDYDLVLFFYGAGLLVPSLFYVLKIKQKHQIKARDFSNKKAIHLLKTDFPFCVSQLFFAFRQYSPILVVDLFLGTAMAGEYKIIEQLIMLFRTFFQIVFRFSYSVICSKIKESFSVGFLLWKRINGLSLLFVLFGITVIYTNYEMVFLFFNSNPNFLATCKSLLFALIIPVFIGCNLALEQLVFSLNKNRIYIRITVFITIFGTISLLVFSRFLLLKGIIWSLLTTEIVLFVVYGLLLKKPFNTLKKQD